MNDLMQIDNARPTTLIDSLEKFLRLSVADGSASPQTLRSYREGVSIFITFMGDETAAAHASMDDVERFRAELLERGNKRSTVGTRLTAVQVLFRAAQRWGLRQDNPAAGVRAPAVRESIEDRTKYISLEGARLLMTLPDRTEPNGRRDMAMLGLMLGHGLRVAECASLDVEAVDGRQLRVMGKGQKVRHVTLTDESAALLTAWMLDREQVASLAQHAMFLAMDRGHRGGRMTDRAIRMVVDGYLEKSGLKKQGISCHALRHSFAVWALNAGARIEHLSDHMGHSSVVTTARYAKVVDRIKNNPAENMWSSLGERAR